MALNQETREEAQDAITDLRATLDRLQGITETDEPTAKQKRLARALTKFVKFEADQVAESITEMFHNPRDKNGNEPEAEAPAKK